MNVVQGLLITDVTGQPLPNLVVAAYDLDGERRSRLAELAAQYLIKALPAADWSGFEAQRLGSVMTDAEGRFVLEFDDQAFADPSELGRPDLVLVVLAPERTKILGEPVSALGRVLHVSPCIRMGAARREAYVIALDEQRLKAFGVPAARSNSMAESPTELGSYELISALEQREQHRATLESSVLFQNAFQASRAAARQRVMNGQTLAKRVLATPPQRENLVFASAPHERAKLQAEQLRVGLERFSARGAIRVPVRGAAGEPGASLSAADAQLAIEANGESLDRSRLRSVLDSCFARRRCRELRHGSEAGTVPVEDPELPAAGGGESVDARAFVSSRVLGAIESMRSYDRDDLPSRGSESALERKLRAMELAKGPADTTAFHDYHGLQLAFRSVWERAFDKQMAGHASELYADWVSVREYLGLEEPAADALAELRTLQEFLDAVERDLAAASALSESTGSAPAAGAVIVRSPGGVRGSVVARTRGGAGRVVVTPPAVAEQPAASDNAPEDVLTRAWRLMTGLAERQNEPYAFDVFAKNTFNFALLTTYRQRLEPEAYQAGELVATLPLTPGEKRVVTSRRVVRARRSEQQSEATASRQSGETRSTGRAEAEILQKATTATNFNQAITANFSLGEFLQIGTTTSFGSKQEQESSKRKRDFSESVRAAAEEYRRERSIELTTELDDEAELSSTHEISNPNNEITVTYLFYELQRRYRMTQRLHRVRPVILVAQDVPSPESIDEAWLLAHEPVLRRVFTSPALHEALDYLRSSLGGDEFAVQALRVTWRYNLDVVTKIAAQLEARRALRDEARERIVGLLRQAEVDETAKDVATAIFTGGFSLLVGNGGDGQALAAAKDAANKELEYADSDLTVVESRLRQAVSALEAATDKYVAALRAQLNHRVAIDQARLLVKENIIPVMHAVWAHEPPDQRFFRLYDLQVPWFQLERTATATIVRETESTPSDLTDASAVIRLLFPTAKVPRIFLETQPSIEPTQDTRALVDVADIDNVLGWKHNYAIIPLKVSNPLIELMLQDYPVDEILGVLDPDQSGNVSAEELEHVLRCLEDDEQLSAEERERLRDAICQRALKEDRESERIIVPTGQLFVEALPGDHAVLEDFKLRHRALDEMRVEAEVRGMELENLRRANRILSGELAEFDADKLIKVQGGEHVHVET